MFILALGLTPRAMASLMVNNLDSIIVPASSKLIRPLSKSVSNVGDSNIPLNLSSRSRFVDIAQGLIWEALSRILLLH